MGGRVVGVQMYGRTATLSGRGRSWPSANGSRTARNRRLLDHPHPYPHLISTHPSTHISSIHLPSTHQPAPTKKDTDKASEAACVAAIAAAFPGHAILGEEGGVITGDVQSEYLWWGGDMDYERVSRPRPHCAHTHSLHPQCNTRTSTHKTTRTTHRHTPFPPTQLHTTTHNFTQLHTDTHLSPSHKHTHANKRQPLPPPRCIDPIDGTCNFAHGFQGFCCSIGVLRHSTPVAGCVVEFVGGPEGWRTVGLLGSSV